MESNPRTSVASCHGVGKTFVSAATSLAFLYTNPNSIVITTAPTARQVKELLWREINELHTTRLGPELGRCLTTQLEIGPKWFATGLATDDPDKFQGFHASSGRLLAVVDEAAGVKREIYAAIDGILTAKACKLLLIGNPTATEGKFFDTHHKLRGTWNPIRISAFDSPNFTGETVPELLRDTLVDTAWVDNAREEWGEESPLWKAKVLGQFPDQTEDGLIALSWIEAASSREDVVPEGPVTAGVDVARHGACETVVYVCQGFKVLGMEAWRKQDFNYSCGRILDICAQYGVERIRVDATGMGMGLCDMLRSELRLSKRKVEEVYVGTKALEAGKFNMLRDELWWTMRMALRDGLLGGLQDERTKAQLLTMKYFFNRAGKIYVESKDDLLKRGEKSPDRADALCLAVARTRKKQQIATA